jgi:hypothetical protein
VISTADGDSNYPFGDEVSGVSVANLTTTLAKARANGASVLWGRYAGQGGDSTLVRFPGGFVTEIHDGTLRRARARARSTTHDPRTHVPNPSRRRSFGTGSRV